MGARDNSGNDIVVVEGTLKHSTTKATLLLVEGKEHWFPNSQMKKPSVEVDAENQEWAIFVPKWLTESNNVNYDTYEESDWPVHTCDKDTGEIP